MGSNSEDQTAQVMIWGDMASYGYTFRREYIALAWNDWDPSLGHRDLMRRLMDQYGACELDRLKYVTMRVADRMMQKARKAGLAKYENGKWSKVNG